MKTNPKLAACEDTHRNSGNGALVVRDDSPTVLGAEVDMASLRERETHSHTPSSSSLQSKGPCVVLMPHNHTLFCERKQRVCTAVGKLQELETLKFANTEKGVKDWVWIRRKSASAEDFTVISGTKNKLEYSLQQEDVGHYIGTKYTDSTASNVMSNFLGPVLPGPPRLVEFIITGDCKIGSVAVAEAKYIGGSEGASEFWWIRVTKDGKRDQITKPKAINSGSDPRRYVITNDDIGCTLKAKCKPIRSDKAEGEIFTSKSSARIVA